MELITKIPDKLAFHRGKGSSKYKELLEKAFDGHAYKFTHGVDFTCRPLSFCTMLLARAKEAGKQGTGRVRGNHVYFQVTSG